MNNHQRNFIQLSNSEINLPIYRIYNTDRLLEIFSTDRLTLSRPKLWDDPFENYIHKSKILHKNMLTSFDFKDQFYGQCWSLHRETDAMWRIYSQDKNGVKVKTTIKKLFYSLYDSLSEREDQDISCFIGKVLYLPQKDIVESFKTKKIADKYIFKASPETQAWTLLLKRKEFSHEKEIRLIFDLGDKKSDLDIFRYKIDPFDLFDEIVFDPRMNDYRTKTYIDYFKHIGYNKRVAKSKLYSLPEMVFVEF
ncbi:MAG: DUF2971 domain-containing protein [Calditrichales bacterium]|nr:DUF2971 domain-containing protein [Calditrichales bacterium]